MKIKVRTDDAEVVMTGAGAFWRNQVSADVQVLIAAKGKDAEKLVEELANHTNLIWPKPADSSPS